MRFGALMAFVTVASIVGCSSAPSEDDDGTTVSESQDELKHAKLCGGFAGFACPKGDICVDIPNDGCDPTKGAVDCLGTCKPAPKAPKPKACGGFAGLKCPAGQTCVDDPSDSCDPTTGGADCGGICQPTPPPAPKACGGFAGLPCPAGQTCIDDPSDTCNPHTGGADCPGICH